MRILVLHPHSISNFYFSNQTLSFSNTTVSKSTRKIHAKSCSKTSIFSFKLPKIKNTHRPFCSKGDTFDSFTDTLLPKTSINEEEIEELELHNKPSPKQVTDESIQEIEVTELTKPDKDEILEPFLKFFKPVEDDNDSTKNEGLIEEEVSVEYYEPKAGDLVFGVVVSGNENRLDVNVGADLLGLMLTKEILPLYDKEMDYLSCDLDKDAEEFFVRGKVGILRNDEAMSDERRVGKTVVELGTVLFAEVLGRTLGGRPLLSARKLFRRIAWHRVRSSN